MPLWTKLPALLSEAITQSKLLVLVQERNKRLRTEARLKDELLTSLERVSFWELNPYIENSAGGGGAPGETGPNSTGATLRK
jgi:hypothetical protein